MLALFGLFTAANCATHAVLIAGSKSYKNYRHQSDVFTMYQVLRSRGVADENIIIFAYDDVVQSSSNPHKGSIYNEEDGNNVYPGRSRVDYRGKDVNTHNIYSCLLGNSTGRNLKSTNRDNVLIFFNDHGAPGTLALPIRGVEGKLFANELNDVMNEVARKRKFKKLLFVIEACESGSVGEVIEVPNMLTITASNAMESSRAYKWDEGMSTFLSNLFTFYIFEVLRKNSVNSVKEMFDSAKRGTFKSEVCYFGDANLLDGPITDYFGHDSKNPFPLKNSHKYADDNNADKRKGVGSWHVFPAMIRKKMKNSEGTDKVRLEESLKIENDRRKATKARFAVLLKKTLPQEASKNSGMRQAVKVKDWKCYRDVVIGAENILGGYEEDSYRNWWVLAKLCNKVHDANAILDNLRRS